MPKTIYKDKFILIQPSNESAVPGLYTIKPLLNIEFLNDLSDIELALFSYMQRQIRIGLRKMFNIILCGLYVEEHPGRIVTSHTIPFHIDKLAEHFSVDIYQPYIAEYLRSYAYTSSQKQIDLFNTRMKEMLNSPIIRHDVENIVNGIVNVSNKNASQAKINKKVSKIEEILEVFDESELPVAPKGKKYFVCIGGKKNFQCFLDDSRFSKGEFIISHEDEIDDSLKCIYSDNHIIVRQDAKYAIPGFYIISTKHHYQTLDEMSQDLYKRCMFMARDIKNGLSSLGIRQTHVYNDEKYNSPASVHFWVLPIHEDYIKENVLNPTIYSRDIWTYLDIFPRFTETRPLILKFNKKMKRFLNEQDREA